MALDDTSLVEAGEAAKQNNLSGAIVYGIGNSTEAVYYLDTRWAESLIVSDEFTAGYQCVADFFSTLLSGLSPANIIGTFFCIFFSLEYSLLPPTIFTIIASAPLSISC